MIIGVVGVRQVGMSTSSPEQGAVPSQIHYSTWGACFVSCLGSTQGWGLSPEPCARLHTLARGMCQKPRQEDNSSSTASFQPGQGLRSSPLTCKWGWIPAGPAKP